jgi:hypothetical protein
LSADSLSREDFLRADGLFEPYRNWLNREGGQRVAFIPRQRLEYLAQGKLVDLARNLVNERGVASLGAEDIKRVERFLLFTEHLMPFLNNLVVFPYLYDPTVSALFESGSFVADGRRFAFSVKVKDVAKHKASAVYSRMYVMYLEVYVIGGSSYKVAVPVTTGSEGRLYKGKHGLFRESDGTERDAVIIDILENPISVPETLVMPFRKAYKTVASRIEEASRKAEDKLAKSAAERADAALSSTAAPGATPGGAAPAAHAGAGAAGAASAAGAAAPGGAAVPGKPGARPASAGIPGVGGMAGMGGLVASGGIAVAALGSSFAFIGKTLSEMSLRALLTTFGALAAAILLPVLISALSKLSSRDLSPLLEASGMAMNRRIRLTRAQARAFTVNPRKSRRDRESEREHGERRKA